MRKQGSRRTTITDKVEVWCDGEKVGIQLRCFVPRNDYELESASVKVGVALSVADVDRLIEQLNVSKTVIGRKESKYARRQAAKSIAADI